MKINELEDLLGVSRATVRYYEEHGLVTPPRSENGYRDYGDEEIRLLQKIIILRKLGVGVPEIKNLIADKADLHDVLKCNAERLRTQQDEIAAAIEMCDKIENEAADFDSIDPPKYLKYIYEDEQKGVHYVRAEEISARQLNLSITLLGALAGVAVPQNKLFSERSNDPLPDDIRANKKEGDSYATIGNLLSKGGKTKAFVIAVLVFIALLVVVNGVLFWGEMHGPMIKQIIDFDRSGISLAEPDGDEAARIIAIDPEASDAIDNYELLTFHTKGNLLLKLKLSEGGEWTELYSKEIDVNKGYLFITGGPSSGINLHIITDGGGETYSIKVNDKRYDSKNEDGIFISLDSQDGLGQCTLNEERTIALDSIDYETWTELEKKMDGYLFKKDITRKSVPDGCYAVTAQDTE